MVIKYEFLTGEKNWNRRETRRHQSLNELNDKVDLITDESVDIEKDILQKFEIDKLYDAMSKLKPPEQELMHKLYLSKNPMTQIEFSKEKNISVGNIKMRLQRIKLKLKKF